MIENNNKKFSLEIADHTMSYHLLNTRKDNPVKYIEGHSPYTDMEKKMKFSELCQQYMELFNVQEWTSVIPALQFHHAYKVKVFPPVGAALVRILITEPKEVSIYLDGYSMLGTNGLSNNALDTVYWEAWFTATGYTNRWHMTNHEMMMKEIEEYCFETDLEILMLNTKNS